MNLTFFALLALCLVAVARTADEEYDYEEEPAQPAAVTPAPARANPARLGGLLSSRGRVNVGGRKPAATAQSTTAKAVEQPEEEELEAEEPIEEGEEQEEVPTTTTESSKKIRGGVRPFRSNQDLLAALKRRRAQAGPSSHSKETSASQSAVDSTTAKSKATTSNRAKSTSTGESRTAGRGRFGSSRGNKPLQEEVEETQREEVQVKPKSYRRG